MLPPLTTQTKFPLPHFPLKAAAAAQAPAHFRNDMVSFCNDSHRPPNLVERTDHRPRKQMVRQVPDGETQICPHIP